MNQLVFQGTFKTYLKRLWPVIVAILAVIIITFLLIWQVVEPILPVIALAISAVVLSSASDTVELDAVLKLVGIDDTKLLELAGAVGALSTIYLLFLVAMGFIAVWEYIIKSRYVAEKTLLNGQPLIFHGRMWALIKINLLASLMFLGAIIVSVIFALFHPAVMVVILSGFMLLIVTWSVQRVIQWFVHNLEITDSDDMFTYSGSFWRLFGWISLSALVFGLVYGVILLINNKLGMRLGERVALEGLGNISKVVFSFETLFTGGITTLSMTPVMVFLKLIFTRFIVKNTTSEHYTLSFKGSIKYLFLLYLIYFGVIYFIQIILQGVIIHLALSSIYSGAIIVMVLYFLGIFFIGLHMNLRVMRWVVEGIGFEEITSEAIPTTVEAE